MATKYEIPITATEIAEEVGSHTLGEYIGIDSEGNFTHWMIPSITISGKDSAVIALDLVRIDDGTVSRRVKITVELL